MGKWIKGSESGIVWMKKKQDFEGEHYGITHF